MVHPTPPPLARAQGPKPSQRVTALREFLPLWRKMSKTQQRFGLLWHGAAFESALLPVEALVEAWCDDQKATFDATLKKSSELHAEGGWRSRRGI